MARDLLKGLVPEEGGLPPLGTERVGTTPEGRPVIKNPDGSFSTERSITVTHPSINGGRATNIPSMFGGRQVSEREAVRIIAESGGVDPETGRQLPGFGSIAEAEAAAQKRSSEIVNPAAQGSQPRDLLEGILPPANRGPAITPGLRPGTALPGGGISVPLSDGAPAAAPAPAAPGFGTAFLRGGSRQFLDNMLAVPELAVNLPAQALSQGINAVAGTNLQPAPFNMPSAAEVTAGTHAAIGTPEALLTGGPGFGQRFENALQRQQAVDTNFQQQAPTATMLGEVTGDIATIATGRAPIRAPLRAATTAPAPAATAAQLARPNVERRLARGFQVALNALPRGAARAAETGTEAAFLAALQGGDPEAAAAIGAGAQTATALPRAIGKGVFSLIKNNKIATAVFTATVAGVGIADILPGGDPGHFLETFEGVSKNTVVLGLLGLAGAGLGRIPPSQLRPGLAEIIELIPRGGLDSVIAGIGQDPERVGPVVQQFSEDPSSFGKEARDELAKVLTDGGDLVATIDRLQRDNPRFARTFDAISQGQPVPAGDLISDAVSADNEGSDRPLRSATSVAEVAARRLGRERAEGFGFGGRDTGPRGFINRTIEGGGGELLQKRLSSRDWQDLLVTDLEGRLQSATVKRNGQRFLDGNKLAAAWSRLPKAARALYPKHVEDSVMGLAERARASRVNGGIPQFIARSLLQQDGQLRTLLNDDARTGKRRSRGLLED